MGKNVKVRNVNGFSLTLGHTGTEWSTNHRELGEKLEYEPAGNFKHFLSFVDRLLASDPGFQALGLVSESAESKLTGRGGTVTEYRVLRFTRKQSLYIIAKSNKPAAATVTLAMVEAFDMILSGANASLSAIPFLLRDDFCPWDLMWDEKTVRALCGVYGWRYNPARFPHQMRSVIEKIYKLVWGQELYDAVKEKAPNPAHHANQHQMLREKARERFRDQLPFIRHTALDCRLDRDAFWARLENVYGGHAMQLRLAGMHPSNTNAHAQLAAVGS